MILPEHDDDMQVVLRTRIFHIDEILLTLIAHCDKPTLARLARTSKAVSDPAIDALWENLESFSHLLRIFPKELVSWHASESSAAKPVRLQVQIEICQRSNTQ